MSHERAYYNECDPYAAQWLRNLIAAGHIADGDVDERSIEDVRPSDILGYTSCHFFAGFGGWPLAFQIAGWPDSRSVWSGSCPCQPFSSAGKGDGFADERHLWPALEHLIRQCGPTTFFGEQVANAAPWLFLVRSDLEALDYAVGAMPIEAACTGAEQFRDRFFIVADRPFEYDGRPNSSTRARQESKPRSDLRPINDEFGTIRVAGRLLPDASFPLLANEIPFRLDQYRAFGNAIVPETAAAFIRAYLDVERGGVAA